MAQFDSVAAVRATNVYFDGKVSSRTLIFTDGSRKTLGIMLPGEYEFNTDDKELLEITSGKFDVRRPGAEWRAASGGECFEVPGKSSFQVKIHETTDYCCSFLKQV